MKKNVQTPKIENNLTADAKIQKIESDFKSIMQTLGLDLEDDSLNGTPKRVAKMFVNELFWGLNDSDFPKMTVQDNKFEYDQMLIETNIDVRSACEHHWQPIVGVAHIAYIPGKSLIGLSKLNRVTDYFSRRPQVQERLTEQIADKLKEVLQTDNIAVVIDAEHFCVKMRGIKHQNCTTRTSSLGGAFKEDNQTKTEFFNSIPRLS